jgi:hypothetical protein
MLAWNASRLTKASGGWLLAWEDRIAARLSPCELA